MMNNPAYLYAATVVNVVDGDTVDAVVDLGFGVSLKMRFRLAGIDTPEMNSRITEERNLAKLATEYVKDKILNKQVVMKTYKKDKFGRFLADIYIDGLLVNELLIKENLAKPYTE